MRIILFFMPNISVSLNFSSLSFLWNCPSLSLCKTNHSFVYQMFYLLHYSGDSLMHLFVMCLRTVNFFLFTRIIPSTFEYAVMLPILTRQQCSPWPAPPSNCSSIPPPLPSRSAYTSVSTFLPLIPL